MHTNNLELALSDVSSILISDPKNFYAIALERRLKRVLEVRKKSPVASNATNYSRAKIIAALEHVCQMAVQQMTNPSPQATIHDMNRQLKEQTLENKHQELLHRARQHVHIQEYERALQEAERARIIRPHSGEADSLILEIKSHIVTPPVKEKQSVQEGGASRESSGKPKYPREGRSKTAIERPEAVTEKILSSISYADYYRTNADYTACLQYIELGLEHDPSNEVLLQMKEEVIKSMAVKISEKKKSFQLV